MRREIRLSGFGGQGLILAGIILAEAGYDGHQVVQTQSYGPEARGEHPSPRWSSVPRPLTIRR